MTYDAALTEWIASHPGVYRRTPSKRTNYTARAAARISQGTHPVMHPLRLRQPVGEETCGSCAHLTAFTKANRYLKCELFNTSSEATDIRKKWPACASWKPA